MNKRKKQSTPAKAPKPAAPVDDAGEFKKLHASWTLASHVLHEVLRAANVGTVAERKEARKILERARADWETARWQEGVRKMLGGI